MERTAAYQSGQEGAVLKEARVVILDRDLGFVRVLAKRLERLGVDYLLSERVVTVERLPALRASALVVDCALLGNQPLAYLLRLREELPALAVLVCSPPTAVANRVAGLRSGADDWVTKPCHPEEVIARLEAVLRRRAGGAFRREAKAVQAGELEIRPDRFQAYVRGVSLDLTKREYGLLELLAQAQGRVLEREEIYSRLWGYVMVRGDRSVDVYVRRVRQKLQAASPGWRYIHTHFGFGYRFAAEPLAGEEHNGAHRAREQLPSAAKA